MENGEKGHWLVRKHGFIFSKAEDRGNSPLSALLFKGEPETTMENTKVLLVEDDQDDAVLNLRALKRNNIEDRVYVVRDGEEALDFLFCTNKFAKRDPQDLPKLILLDMELPNM